MSWRRESLDDFHIAIIGGIATGKSTLLDELVFKLRESEIFTNVVHEPIEELRQYGRTKENLLESFYSDPTRGFAFQMALSSLRQNQLANVEGIFIAERSFRCQQLVFAPILLGQQDMTASEFNILHNHFQNLVNMYNHRPEIYIFLRASAERQLERIAIRGRPEEVGINIEYLEKINQFYERWMARDSTTKMIVETDTGPISPAKIEEIVKFIKEQIEIRQRRRCREAEALEDQDHQETQEIEHNEEKTENENEQD